MDSIKVFSPGSVTNLSCGYDVLGVCLENRGDEIEVHKTKSIGKERLAEEFYRLSDEKDYDYSYEVSSPSGKMVSIYFKKVEENNS